MESVPWRRQPSAGNARAKGGLPHGEGIAEGRESLDGAPHISLVPAGVMFLTVLAFNLVGDTCRALADPRRGP
jgi:hypothetical protein